MSKANSIPTSKRFRNLTGQVFGRLRVISYAGLHKKGVTRLWSCQCSCGNGCVTGAGSLMSGGTASCGCIRKAGTHRSHGMTRSPEHTTWMRMWSRCTNPKNPDYNKYKDRKPPEAWRDFEEFFRELGARPSSAHSLDRIRNDMPYGPGNCRWATRSEQNRNKSNNVNVVFDGKGMCLQEACRVSGVPRNLIMHRVHKLGQNIFDASRGAFYSA